MRSQPEPPIVLVGYRPVRRSWPIYVLARVTREFQVRTYPDQAAAMSAERNVRGVADVRRLGSWWWNDKGLIAVHVENGRLFLWLDGLQIDLMNDGVQIRRRLDLLLRKRFTVHVDGALVFDVHYSYLDWEDLPDEDIFWYIARELRSMEGRYRALLIREDRMSGVADGTDAYYEKLESRVAARLAMEGRAQQPAM